MPFKRSSSIGQLLVSNNSIEQLVNYCNFSFEFHNLEDISVELSLSNIKYTQPNWKNKRNSANPIRSSSDQPEFHHKIQPILIIRNTHQTLIKNSTTNCIRKLSKTATYRKNFVNIIHNEQKKKEKRNIKRNKTNYQNRNLRIV